ncbi:MAG: Lactate utilization protein B [Promethearchaeota archaeon]|nr:MAG: Lactate utilization protein B [Candidatus Lokiarchaeota archaeon]
MSDKNKELYDHLKGLIEKIDESDNYYNAFTDFWRIACAAQNSTINTKYKYDDSSKEFIEKYKKQLSDIRKELVNNIEYYVEKTMKSMEKNKMKVHYAKTNEEAHTIFLEELGDIETVYKSKSVEAKDIGILELLKENNITVKETDLGDVLIQLFDYKLPTYQVGPGIHFEIEKIVSKIKEVYGAELPPKAESIVQFFRDTYRKELLNDVKVSLTSANSISAEDGCIVLLENEGNISLLTRATEKHIVLVGISKIVPSVFDALLMTKMVERTNQADLAYISFIYGPSATSDIRAHSVQGMYGAKEVVIILVDDWRTNAIKEDLFYKSFLQCIGCKTCSFYCTASKAFGNVYGSKYGIGAIGILRDYIHNGIEAAVRDGLYLCTGCEKCTNWCPAEVNLAEIMRSLKKIATEKGLAPPPLEKYRQKIKQEKNPFS